MAVGGPRRRGGAGDAACLYFAADVSYFPVGEAPVHPSCLLYDALPPGTTALKPPNTTSNNEAFWVTDASGPARRFS